MLCTSASSFRGEQEREIERTNEILCTQLITIWSRETKWNWSAAYSAPHIRNFSCFGISNSIFSSFLLFNDKCQFTDWLYLLVKWSSFRRGTIPTSTSLNKTMNPRIVCDSLNIKELFQLLLHIQMWVFSFFVNSIRRLFSVRHCVHFLSLFIENILFIFNSKNGDKFSLVDREIVQYSFVCVCVSSWER